MPRDEIARLVRSMYPALAGLGCGSRGRHDRRQGVVIRCCGAERAGRSVPRAADARHRESYQRPISEMLWKPLRIGLERRGPRAVMTVGSAAAR